MKHFFEGAWFAVSIICVGICGGWLVVTLANAALQACKP
jgi:hypothetical protein